MTFSGQYDHISRLTMFDGIFDRFFSVADLHICPVSLCDSDFDIIDNLLWFFKTRIIRSNDRKIRQTSRHFAHLISSVF